MIKTTHSVVAIAIAFAAGYGLSHISSDTGETADPQPLYWVAPMNPSFRSDKPGKSPMGMDLVPVYEEDHAMESGQGEVRISPAVENNLGVRTATARQHLISRPVQTVGYVSFDEDKLHHIHLRVEGWIERLGVTSTGDRVKQGQKLFDLYAPQLVHAQEELLIALRDGNRALIRAARKKLRSLGVTAAQIRSVEKSRKVMEKLPFAAHENGYVNALNVRHGMFVRPDTEIMSIGSLNSVWVHLEVFEQQTAWVETGQPVEIRVDAYPGRTWTGVVDYVYPVLDATNRTTRVRIRVANTDEALRPNMFASARIDASDDKPVLTVPRSAVIRTGRMDRVVLALGDGRYRSVVVTTGRFSEEHAEILSGLQTGDRVVTSAQFLIDSESSLSAGLDRMQAPMERQDQDSSTMDMQADDPHAGHQIPAHTEHDHPEDES